MEEEVDVYTNKPVRVEDLPSVEEIFFTPLEPNYLRVRMVGALIFWILLMVVAGTITYTTGIISEAFGWIPL
ncbi:MAG: hypothetical protein KJO69_10445, partial [Gammaproteobacteria bacterium]|nr:hypothetical protein [Gammaproteobacteria bacterium]